MFGHLLTGSTHYTKFLFFIWEGTDIWRFVNVNYFMGEESYNLIDLI